MIGAIDWIGEDVEGLDIGVRRCQIGKLKSEKHEHELIHVVQPGDQISEPTVESDGQMLHAKDTTRSLLSPPSLALPQAPICGLAKT